MYSYHISGEAHPCGVASSNDGRFRVAANGTDLDDLRRGATGFISYPNLNGPTGSVAERLAAYGSRITTASGLARYRAVLVAENRTYCVITIVAGATLTGTTDSDAIVPVATSVEVNEVRIDCERRVHTGVNSTYRVTVPYPRLDNAGRTTVKCPRKPC